MRIRLRDHVVECVPGRPLVMGIVNASPDSFSDTAPPPGATGLADRALAMVASAAATIATPPTASDRDP